MTLDNIRRVIAIILGKRVEEVRDLTPDNFSALLHYNSLRYFHRRTGIPEEYQPGMPVSREVIEQVRANSMALRPFIVVRGNTDGEETISINQFGYGNIPDDFFFPLSLSYTMKPDRGSIYGVIPIEIYSNNDFIRRVDDVLEKATKKYPIATFHSKIQIAPTGIRRISMTYLRLPVTPFYATIYANGMNGYDSESSIQLEWNDLDTNSIISMMLESLGVKLEAQDVAQYSFSLNQQGKS